jgi:hypothetical protein
VTASAYMDTCLVSALVKRDIAVCEFAALREILARFERGEISLMCSSAVEDELGRIPSDFREPHLAQLKVFGTIPRVSPGGITRLGLAGVPAANPRYNLWRRLHVLLPDSEDAEHVFIASCNRMRHLITVHERTLLRHRVAVQGLCGVQLVSPIEFINAALAS